MKVVIAGGRDKYVTSDQITEALAKAGFTPTCIVSGGASGIDACGEKWAKDHNIPITLFPALWNKHGKKAGPLRNAEQAKYADALIAFWDEKSPGTKNMIDNMKRLKKPFFIVKI